ncbi:Fic family protein [Arsenicicoccus sp. oral taxon 190]|uniref:Fic family protein n=1 Tax=Arsenicicoccus sp. oral taxon 190 TaxID=1658671 RepID=UPI00067A229A|nr:Fic/DOC family N-terminal domain-containing protein [Arsenicicoccus sp. oral taxon 190]AKT50271.1 cell filamentation protein Fic [Arsenicicoccus sp. oral taxon 190]
MDPSDFIDSQFGAAVRRPGDRWAFTHYQPKPIPRSLTLPMHVVMALSEADTALGNLAGLSTLITDPSTLIGPYLRREALASSRIEGTQASLSDLLQAEVDAQAGSDDVDEVRRYLDATDLAYRLSAELPITQRLILEVHETLLRGVRGEEKNPGAFRLTPVWVGHAGATPETATYVPPLPDEIGALLTDWERFVNEPAPTLPVLVHAAMMHYQFETIHPFLDGNGRIGRLLINVILKERGRLPHPLLYLSSYFEAHRQEYYAALQGVRERGDIDSWLHFFLHAVTEQANDGVARSKRLIGIREGYRARVAQDRSRLPALVELIVHNPFLTVRSVQAALEVTNQGARNLIRRAEDQGFVRSLGTFGRGGRETWLAQEVFDVLEAPMLYADPPALD